MQSDRSGSAPVFSNKAPEFYHSVWLWDHIYSTSLDLLLCLSVKLDTPSHNLKVKVLVQQQPSDFVQDKSTAFAYSAL